MDYKLLVEQIIKNIGGKENINSVTHCATRLRFQLVKRELAKDEEIRKIEGVLGVVYATGQYQVILGKHLLPTFDIITKDYSFKIEEEVKENLDEDVTEHKNFSLKTLGKNIVNYVAGSVTPFVPALIAGGMVKVLLTVIGLFTTEFATTQTYVLLNALADTPFYFMPIFVAYGASKYLKCSPVYAIIVAVAFLYPSYIELLGSGESVNAFGLSVNMIKYSNQIVPTLLSTYVVFWLEKGFNKIIPDIVKPVFVGFCTILVGLILTLFVLGPVGNLIGTSLMNAILWMNETVGPLGVGILTACLPYLLITGTHSLAGPLMTQSIATVGYDPLFRPSLMLQNMADCGSCLGVALKTKDKDLKSEAFSCSIAAILGVAEPGLFGIGLAYKTPLIANSIGGFIGGSVAGLFGAKAFSVGYSSIIALPIFETTIIAMGAAIIVTIITSCIVSFVLYKNKG